MSKQLRVAIVGKSPLSLYLARELDKYLGPLVQYDLTWITDGEEMVTDLLDFDLVGKVNGFSIKKDLDNTKVRIGTVKSINLRTQEIITTRGSINYDFLLLDQIPYYSVKELSAIYKQFATLLGALSAVRRSEKPVSALAVVGGESVNSWQLALSLRSFQLKHYPSLLRRISIQIENSPLAVKNFLNEHSIEVAASKSSSGIRISAPLPLIQSKLIKGAKIDRTGHIMSDPFLRVRGFDNVVCFDSPEWLRSNLHRVFKSFSKRIVESVEDFFENRSVKKLHIPTHSLLLRSHKGNFALFGDLKSKNFRAALIAKLEKSLRD